MDDEQLNQLALDAQHTPPGSPARQVALTQLINGLINSGRLSYPPGPGLSPDRYQDYRSEALQNLFYYICQSIDKYDSERAPVMRWVNVLLERRFFKDVSYRRISSQRNIIIEPLEERLLSPSEWNLIFGEDQPFLSDLVRQCFEDDPDGVFRECCLVTYPQVNFQILVLRRLDGYQWQEISEEFSVKVSTLSTFYQTCLRNLSPYIESTIRDTNP
ncbi:sigma-70 family RNA polymerase sigma factor [Phormidium yuhuli AB48]|uniref:Sigma-70 family RNA polymerase sigma factor n=1 Tax=Phormidium yuhuli AB48 TaxID=2940671 RepID=A0ABY5AMG4_9CYAN|nr:sigma-70 family RNA polymerase sigma factor [Phormidium yuhuli]USR90403.1 sigma-70 family RNA polymerase sigma factor [Phormidium yuhuli AB48]